MQWIFVGSLDCQKINVYLCTEGKIMNMVIAHGHAFRLLRNNSIEFAPIKKSPMKIEIDESKWSPLDTTAADITGADSSEISSQLQRLNAIFYDDRKRTSSAMPLVEH